MFLNQKRTLVAMSFLALILASGAANAKCGGQGGHGAASNPGPGRAVGSQAAVTEGRAAFIDDSYPSAFGFDGSNSIVYPHRAK